MKNKIILLIIILGVFLVSSYSTVLAQDESGLELVYPSFDDYANSPNSRYFSSSNLIQYLYIFSIAAVGLIAFLCVLIGGARYLTSVGNPSIMQDARNQITSGLLGMVIIFGSYLILRTINPDLTSFAMPQIPVNPNGIVFYSDNQCGTGANGDPYSIDLKGKGIEFLRLSDTRANLGANKDGDPGMFTIKSFYSYYSKENVDLTFYKTKDCSGKPTEIYPDNPLASSGDPGFVLSVGCCNSKHGCVLDPIASPAGTTASNSLEISEVRCIKFVWKNPGVWLFDYANGNPLNPQGEAGINYANYQANQNIGDLSDKVKSLALLKDMKREVYYGAILHNYEIGVGNRDWAEVFLPNFGSDVTVYNLGEDDGKKPLDASSVTVFRIPVGDAANPTDTFSLYREVSRRSVQNEDVNNTGLVTPQRQIGWNTPIAAFEDLTAENDICKGHDGNKAFTASSSIAILSDPPGSGAATWTPLTSCSGSNKAPLNIVGGLDVTKNNLKWLGDNGSPIKINDGIISIHNNGGVEGIFFPNDDPYLALLYGENTTKDTKTKDSLRELILNGASVESQAVFLRNSYSALSKLDFADQLKTLVVIRISR